MGFGYVPSSVGSPLKGEHLTPRSPPTPITVNVDISVCINFHGFMEMGNFA